jgi:hypothetical protein
MIHPDASAKSPAGGHYTEDFWNMRIIGVSAEPFFMITQEACLCRKSCTSMHWAHEGY